MIDIDQARKAAQEAESGTTRLEDAARNWAAMQRLAALVRKMASEIERLRPTKEERMGYAPVAADDMMSVRIYPCEKYRVGIQVRQEDDGQSMVALLDIGAAADVAEQIRIAMRDAAR